MDATTATAHGPICACGGIMQACVVELAGESVGRRAFVCHSCEVRGGARVSVKSYSATVTGTGPKRVEETRFGDKSVD